jgi:general secretion pathway protein G
MKKMHRSGWTVLELAIVISLVVILAAILVPTLIGKVEASRNARAVADVGELAKAVARLRTDTTVSTTGCVDVLTNLTANVTDPPPACIPAGTLSSAFGACTKVSPGTPCWSGPYMGSLPVDPWGDSYYATLNTTNFTVTIGSAGPDCQSGTADDDTFVE